MEMKTRIFVAVVNSYKYMCHTCSSFHSFFLAFLVAFCAVTNSVVGSAGVAGTGLPYILPKWESFQAEPASRVCGEKEG